MLPNSTGGNILTTDADGKVTITLSGGDNFDFSDGVLSATQAKESFVVVATTADSGGNAETGVKLTQVSIQVLMEVMELIEQSLSLELEPLLK